MINGNNVDALEAKYLAMQGQYHENTHIFYLPRLLTGTSKTQVVEPQYCNIAVAIICKEA